MLENGAAGGSFGQTWAVFIIHFRHNSVLDNHAHAHAAVRKMSHGKVHLEAESFGELPVAVSQVVDLILTAEVLRKSSHNEGIVYGHRDDLIDALSLQLVGILDVFRNVGGHAGGRKGTRVANNNKVLVLGVFRNVELLGAEAIVAMADNRHSNAGHLITHLYRKATGMQTNKRLAHSRNKHKSLVI